MLKKLLKYDLKSMLNFWWITALSSIVATAIGSGCSLILNSDKYDLPNYVNFFLGLTCFLAVVVIIAFPLISNILIYLRFYQNFFTDEGYLTFTLPAKRSQLLNSKLISAFIASSVTYILLFFEFIIFYLVSYLNFPIKEAIKELLSVIGSYSIILLIEIIALTAVLTLITILFTFGCITFASVITKKAKLITAIGIYYGTSIVLSGFLEFLYVFGGIALIEKIFTLKDQMIVPVIVIVLLCIVLFLSIICLLLYVLEHYLLDRKLNLN